MKTPKTCQHCTNPFYHNPYDLGKNHTCICRDCAETLIKRSQGDIEHLLLGRTKPKNYNDLREPHTKPPK